MYEAHFGLSGDPFRLNPTATPKFQHGTYRRAMAYFAYALGRREGILMLTGTPGTGKTSLVRDFVASVADPDLVIETIVCSSLDGEDVIRAVALRFGIVVENASKAMLYEQLEARLSGLWDHGRRPLLIIDEAQGLSRDALEQIRSLTNLQRGDDALLQVFLVGQPSLKDTVRAPGLEQLHQRLIVACRLEPLDVQDLEDYVRHAMEIAGLQGEPPFTADVYPLVHGESFGIPRRINLIMSRLLLHGMVKRRDLLTMEDANNVLDSMREDGLLFSSPWRQPDAAHASVTDEAAHATG